MQTQAEEQLHRFESEMERQRDAKSREAEVRLREELQQKELGYLAKLKQREAELTDRAAAREADWKKQSAADLRARDAEWEREAESRVRATETRLAHEAQQKEELFQAQSIQRDQQWQVKLDAARAELQAQNDQVLRRREVDAEARLRALETSLRKEMQQKHDAGRTEAKQREQDLLAQLTAQGEAHKAVAQQWEAEAEKRTRGAIEPLKELLARTEKERDAAIGQVQNLESKLTEVSSFLNGWKNGKQADAPRGGKNTLEGAPELGTSELWSQPGAPERSKHGF